MIAHYDSEAALTDTAGAIARRWSDGGCVPLLIGLHGELGSGKTTWVRAMLRGLGYAGRVPSPTYTLLESYPLTSLTLVHLDLYRLRSADELEPLGVRDWLARSDVWLLVEWPERAPPLQARCDLLLTFELTGATARRMTMRAQSASGGAALRSIGDANSNLNR